MESLLSHPAATSTLLSCFFPVGAVRHAHIYGYFLFTPATSPQPASAAQAGAYPSSSATQRAQRTPARLPPVGRSPPRDAREDGAGRAASPPPHLALPAAPVLTVEQAPRHLPAHGHAVLRGRHRRPFPSRSHRPRKEPLPLAGRSHPLPRLPPRHRR